MLLCRLDASPHAVALEGFDPQRGQHKTLAAWIFAELGRPSDGGGDGGGGSGGDDERVCETAAAAASGCGGGAPLLPLPAPLRILDERAWLAMRFGDVHSRVADVPGAVTCLLSAAALMLRVVLLAPPTPAEISDEALTPRQLHMRAHLLCAEAIGHPAFQSDALHLSGVFNRCASHRPCNVFCVVRLES